MTREEALEVVAETIVSAKHDPAAAPLGKALEALQVLLATGRVLPIHHEPEAVGATMRLLGLEDSSTYEDLYRSVDALQKKLALHETVAEMLRLMANAGFLTDARFHVAWKAWCEAGRPGLPPPVAPISGTPCRVGNPAAPFGERLSCIRDVGHDGEPHIDQRGNKWWDAPDPGRHAASECCLCVGNPDAALCERLAWREGPGGALVCRDCGRPMLEGARAVECVTQEKFDLLCDALSNTLRAIHAAVHHGLQYPQVLEAHGKAAWTLNEARRR